MGMTRRAYGRHRGVSEKAVRKALEAGRITLELDGTINPAKADAQWAANTSRPRNPDTRRQTGSKTAPRGRGQADGDAQPRNLLDAQFEKVKAEGQLKGMQLRHLQGRLIDREVAGRTAFAFARMQRDAWQSWPARVSAILLGEIAEHQAQGKELDVRLLTILLEKHVREHLVDLSRQPCPDFESLPQSAN